MKNIVFVIFFFLSFSQLFCQGEAAVATLLLEPSISMHGAGQIGAAIPTNDPAGFYFNPANLGYAAQINHFSTFFMPEKPKWLGFQNTTFYSYGFNLGYNFQKIFKNIPVSIGFGYIHSDFEFGKIYTNNSNSEKDYLGNPKDSYNSFSLGVGINYYVLLNFGISIKPFKSELLLYNTTETGAPKILSAKGTALDYGAMLITPISRLLFYNTKYFLDKNSYLTPNITFTLGYSLTNVGDEIYFVDKAQSDPIPRTAKFGYTFNIGLDLFVKKTKINAINYSFTAEAEDRLIKNNMFGETEYQGMMGDIKIGKNLVELKGDDNVTVRRGHIFKFLETFILETGRFDGNGFGNEDNNRKANGIGISSEGIFKLLSALINNPSLSFISHHFVVEYYSSNFLADHPLETNLKGINLYFKNIDF